MSAWEDYEARINARGSTEREMTKRREMKYLSRKIQDSLSYQEAIVEGIVRNVAIINSDNLNQKKIYSLPAEDLPLGGYVEWMNNHWLIIEKDANNELYTKCIMLQCNHVLKWVDDDDVIHEQWCIVEDGTKLRRISFRVVKAACKKYLLNCWEPLKLALLQRKGEIYLNVNVAKAERKCEMVQG